LRLFVGVELPADVRAALDYAARAWRGLSTDGRGTYGLNVGSTAQPNFAHPSLYHVTLCFLGELAPGDVSRVSACMRLVSDAAPMSLRLGECGMFGGRGGQGIGWVGLRGEVGALGALQARLEKQLIAAGFSPDTRAFRPHITLARKLSGGELPPAPPPLVFAVEHIALFHSTRDGRGQLAYIPLERVALHGS